METTTTATTTAPIIHDCSAQTVAEAARRRAVEKARPFILFTKDNMGGWVIEARYATLAQLEAAVAEEARWQEENNDFTPEAGVDFLAVQAHSF